MLDGDLAQLRKSPKGKRFDRGDVVAVERQLLEISQTCKGIAFDNWEMIFGKCEILDC